MGLSMCYSHDVVHLTHQDLPPSHTMLSTVVGRLFVVTQSFIECVPMLAREVGPRGSMSLSMCYFHGVVYLTHHTLLSTVVGRLFVVTQLHTEYILMLAREVRPRRLWIDVHPEEA